LGRHRTPQLPCQALHLVVPLPASLLSSWSLLLPALWCCLPFYLPPLALSLTLSLSPFHRPPSSLHCLTFSVACPCCCHCRTSLAWSMVRRNFLFFIFHTNLFLFSASSFPPAFPLMDGLTSTKGACFHGVDGQLASVARASLLRPSEGLTPVTSTITCVGPLFYAAPTISLRCRHRSCRPNGAAAILTLWSLSHCHCCHRPDTAVAVSLSPPLFRHLRHCPNAASHRQRCCH
jgi:hypothetical protein